MQKIINSKFDDLQDSLNKEGKLRQSGNEELEEALSTDVPTLQELIKGIGGKRVTRGQEIDSQLHEGVVHVAARVTQERGDRVKTEENVF